MRNIMMVLGMVLLIACTPTGVLTPLELSCEYLENPSVLDVARPRLSWINHAGVGFRGQKQTACQVRVAGSVKSLDHPDLWDSGKRISSQSIRVEYEGAELKSRQECWWQVRVWDRDGVASEWSEPAFWRMGLLDPDDWRAKLDWGTLAGRRGPAQTGRRARWKARLTLVLLHPCSERSLT